jgi:hypothetical protein
MKTSPNAVNPFLNFSTSALSALTFLPSASLELPSSSAWKRRFSSRITCPPLAPLTVSSTSLPTQSLVKMTSLPSSFSSSATTGFKLYFELTLPSGRPRCDIKMTAFAPFSAAYLMVGRAPAMRWLFVILSPSRGTLKSTCIPIMLLAVLHHNRRKRSNLLGSRHACP